MSCTSACLTQDHESYGACLRAKGVRTVWANSANGLDASREKRWQGEIDAYRSAVRQGHDPESTSLHAVRAAEAFGDKTGLAYSRENVMKHKTEKVLGKDAL